MASTTVFNPPAPRDVELTNEEDIFVPEPLPQEEQVKQSGFQRFMPFIMIGVMLLMMVVMFSIRAGSGAGLNPMMFMFPVMMMMSMLMMFTGQAGGGTNTGELNKERKDYIYSLRETRKIAHKAGQEVHDVMCKMFPNPAILHNYVGNVNTKDPVMWQYNEENQGGITAFEGTVDEISFKPYMSARMGTGITNLIPNLTFEPLSVPETLEPVTTTQFRSFVRTQGFIPNIPIGVSLSSSGAFAITGDKEKKYGLIRAMLMSLMFNHSPNVLRIAVVTDNIEDPKWQWMKWSQHALHPSANDQLGPYRMVYPDMRTFAQEVPEAVGDRSEDKPHWIVIVDKPNEEVTLPQRTGMGAGGYNSTFIVVAAKTDRIATSKSARYSIDENGEITLPYTDAKLNGDYATLDEIDAFCRSMFCYTPPKTKMEYASGDDGPSFVQRTWFEVLGIDDIDAWNPLQAWSVNDLDDNLITPLGHEYDEVSEKALERIVFIDAAEAAAGGSGPHGIGQGKTGTGKSIMLSAFVLGMVARYSPNKINFLLMDFKGGSTFQRYEKLPHVIASLSNLEESRDLLDRAFLIIQGEIARRQELLDEHDCKDIREYREKRTADPSLPQFPYLFLVVDEFREFITNNRDYLKLFESIAAVGRSLGFHMMLVSQYVDSSLIGEASSQIGFGVSLAVSNPAQSRGVIGIDKAAELPSGRGDAIINYKEGPLAEQHPLMRFRTFFTEEIYIPPEQNTVFEATTIDQPIEDKTLDDAIDRILPYTITPLEFQDVAEEAVEDPTESPEARRAREKARRKQIEAESGKDMMMKNVLIDRIAREPNTPEALELWKPSMRNPISFNEIDVPQRASIYPKLISTVGIIDDPYNHRQYSWDIDFSSPRTNNWLLIGARGTGKTLAMESMIASIARSYPPDAAQFLILSFAGARIKEVDAYPHVIGFADGNDRDYVERYFGEIERIVNLRQYYSTQWASADANTFLEDKLKTPIDGDPYGRLFLFIDGLGSMMREAGTFSQDTMDMVDILGTILSRGPNVGVHVVASTVQLGDIAYKIRDAFSPMYFSMDDVSDVSDREAREIVRTLPPTQPGRSVADHKHARVLVPQDEKIEPVGEKKGNLIFDHEAKYGPAISRLAREINDAYRQRGATIVPQVHPAPADFPYEEMWAAYEHVVDNEARDAYLPIGMKTQDLHVVDLKFETDQQHFLVSGEPKSGKTNTLRVLINNVVRQRTSKKAKFIFYDPRNEFFVEERVLKKHKMSLGHASSPEKMFEIFEQLVMTLESRVPTEEDLSTYSREQIQNREWYTGPDIYVIIDNIMDLEKANGFGNDTPLAKLAGILKAHPNLGCFIFAAARSSDGSYLGTSTSKLSEAMLTTGSGFVLLSGEKRDGKVGPVAFEKFRPGKGKFYNNNSVSTVQIAHALEWEDETRESGS